MGKMNDTDSFEAKVAALLAGLRDRMPPSTKKILVHGEKLTMAGVHERLEAIGKAQERVRKARVAYDEAVKALRATEVEDRRFHDGVERYLRRTFDRNAEKLRPFGLEPL